ncbi:hypothetical protein PISL3812_02770 [Talaromyces islandicus]|uniref:Uncharacterized protein n=1 Tax=Talaromyces islandicus TaxID=28573 RepID=A0A0U1LQU1_TALIS|nr:hypothetical protein PISL3812_02770 [Talaromyces islandicus]
MDPTIILSSLLVLFFLGFNGDSFLGTDRFTAINLLERVTKAISGSTLITGVNTALGVALGTSDILPPRNVSQGPTKRSWNESCTEMPVTLQASLVFERPLKASVCLPENITDILGNLTETSELPEPGPAPFELFGFHLPASCMTLDLIVAAVLVLTICFRLWTSIARKLSTVDDGMIPRKSYVDAAIADLSGRIPDLGPLLANQQRLEGQLIQIDGVEGRVNGRIDNRLHELEVLFQRQIRDIDIDTLTRRAEKFQENHEFMASQIRKLQDDQPRWTYLAEHVNDLEADLTTQIDRKTNRVQASIKDHVEDIDAHFHDIENRNEKLLIEVRQVAKQQTSCNASLDQLQTLEKRVADYAAKSSTLQRQVEGIDAFNQQFKGTKEGTVSIAEKMRKLQQQVNTINTSDERIRGLEDEMASTAKCIRKLQEQEVSGIKRVRDVEGEIASLTQRVRQLQEQSQTEDTAKILSDVLARLNSCLTIARFQEIQTSLNQRISKVEDLLHQIPVVNSEEERAHTQTLLEKLNIDELREKLRTIESEVKEDTQNIIHIKDHIDQTESKIENEFTRTTKETEQLIKNVVQEFKLSLDDVRKTIDTLHQDFKEKALDKEKVEKVVDDFRIDLRIAEEKVGSLELNLLGGSSNVAEGTRTSVMVQINEIQSQLQELADKSKWLSQRQEVLSREQGRLKIETQAFSQSSQPPQILGTSSVQAGSSQEAQVGGNPNTEVTSRQSTQAEIAPAKGFQSQGDNQKGKQRESPVSSESPRLSWADEVDDGESRKSTKSQTTDEKPRKSSARNTAKAQDTNTVRVSPMETPERREEMLWESNIITKILSEAAAENSKGDLSKSQWADPPPDLEQSRGSLSTSHSETPPRRRKGGNGSKT